MQIIVIITTIMVQRHMEMIITIIIVITIIIIITIINMIIMIIMNLKKRQLIFI